MKKYLTVKNISSIAVLGALGAVLMLFDFPIAIAPSFYKIDLGDLLFIHDSGAHGYSMGYNYNGRLRSAEVLLKSDGTFKKIRRAETPMDYYATFDEFDIYKKLEAENK